MTLAHLSLRRATPHPALRATFSHKGRRKKTAQLFSTNRKSIRSLRIHPKRLLPHLRPELRQARFQRALDLAVTPREQAHRPVGAEDQSVLAKTVRGVLDERKQ